MGNGATRRHFLRTTTIAAGTSGVPFTRRGRAQTRTDWRQFGYGIGNTARTAANGPTDGIGPQWVVTTGDSVNSSPAVVDGTVYVGSADGTVYALDARDGTETWAVETGGGVSSSPAVVDGTVYVGSLDQTVYAFEAATGERRWSQKTGGGVVASPVVTSDTVYVGSRDGRVYALGTGDGTVRWTHGTGGEVWSTPAVADGTVYVGSRDNRLYALAAADGAERWTVRTDGWVESPPAVTDGTVYVGSLDQTVYALAAADGAERWTFRAGDAVASSPAVTSDTVYVGSDDDRVYALDTSDGSEKWAVETGDRVFSSPAVTGDTVYVGSADGTVYAFGRGDGTRRWTFETDGPVFSSPVVVDDTVYVGSSDGNVYALADGQGETTQAGGAQRTTTTTANGPGAGLLVPAAFGVLCLGGGAWLLRRRTDSADGQPPTSDDGGTPSGATVDSGYSESERPGERGPVDISHDHIPTDSPGFPNVAVEYTELIDREILASGDVTMSRATVPIDDGGHAVTLFEPDANETLHPENIESFTSAAELWSKLDDHDHVVTVVDYGTSPLPWLATEHMDAGTLADRVGTMELSQALWTAIAITGGVRHAHRHGVAHRQLTPGTVQFRATPAGTWDWPKVGDWGAAWTTSQSDRTAEAAYAAPEQRDESVVAPDEVTDVYRLGAVFYELFTGQPPFGGSPTDVQRAVVNTEPTRPSKIADLPPALDDILLTALEADSDDRYDDIVYLRDALGEVFLSTA